MATGRSRAGNLRDAKVAPKRPHTPDPDAAKGYDIYATRWLGKDKGWAKNEVVHPDKAGDQHNPALAVDGSCKVGVAWRDSAANPSFDVRVTFLGW